MPIRRIVTVEPGGGAHEGYSAEDHPEALLLFTPKEEMSAGPRKDLRPL
jgi:hypothetical protein